MAQARKRKMEYCELLGVPTNADEHTVKKAYHRLVLQCHPDRPNNKGKEEEAGEKFQKITEAYEKLSENSNNLSSLKTNLKSPDVHINSMDFLFLFGGGAKNAGGTNSGVPYKSKPKQTPKRGQSLKAVLHLSSEESSKGCSKTIEFTRTLNCKHCGGTGNSKTSSPQTCGDCQGKGIRTTLINGKTLGASNISTACRTCHSTGFVGSKDCLACDGSGKQMVQQTQPVQVFPGTITGMKQVFEGEGDEGHDGGPNGDLVLWFEVEGTPFVETPVREGKKRGRKSKLQKQEAAATIIEGVPSVVAIPSAETSVPLFPVPKTLNLASFTSRSNQTLQV